MRLTAGQGAALGMLGRFLQDRSAPMARLTGYAGSGKTTLLSLVTRGAEAMGRRTRILAPTGKAALRVQEASGRDAMTIHKYLYTPITDEERGEMRFAPKGIEDLEEDRGALIVVDEASMMGRKVWHHLLQAARAVEMQVLLVGDTFQLEPVGDEGDAGAPFEPLRLPTPHSAHLDEVVRQALDSSVLRAATGIRLARTVMDVSRALAELTPMVGRTPVDAAVERPDVPVLVHRNATRHAINVEVRARRGLPATPTAGEPLLVLRNNYVVNRFNGEVVTLRSIGPIVGVPVKDRRSDLVGEIGYALADLDGARAILSPDEVAGATFGRFNEMAVAKGARDAFRRELLRPSADEPVFGPGQGLLPPHVHANYGYSLTCHKSQGSEWSRIVMVLEPSVALHEVSGRRWAYTAVSRAKHEVVWTYL